MQSTWNPPKHQEFVGEFVTLRPLDVARDIDALYAASHGDTDKESVWRFLFYGPFESAEQMAAWYAANMTGPLNPFAWSVFARDGRPVGITSLLNIVPTHARAEIGHVWFTTSVHRTKTNTESQFLLLKHLFCDLRYRRVEWKCDALNQASRLAATRMGFQFEGRFRQHMVVRGKNRDTDWFAMTDKDWPRCRQNFETWLYSEEPSSLLELNTGV